MTVVRFRQSFSTTPLASNALRIMNSPPSDHEELAALLSGKNPVEIARSLIGQEIISEIGGNYCRARITETEAYWAPDDQASHAKNNRRTARTEVFYRASGTAYVYLCYGIHELFNVVTGPVATPHAILIRAVEPLKGLEHMLERRAMKTLKPHLSAGPGVLTKALGITRQHNGSNLLSAESAVRLGVTDKPVAASDIIATPRIGIGYAGEPWVEKPWRFYLDGTPFVSKLRK